MSKPASTEKQRPAANRSADRFFRFACHLRGLWMVTALTGLLILPGCSTEDHRIADPPWPQQTRETRPWTRMWWMGNAVNKDDMARLMEEYARSGLGGIEITPIYGVKGFEEQYIDFLSPGWMDMLDFTIQEADKHDIGVDINLGTGWPYGGPHITPQHAAKRIVIRSYPVDGGSYSPDRGMNELLLQRRGDSLLALFAVPEEGVRINIVDRVDTGGIIEWTPPEGRWQVFAAVSQNTGQLVKRAAPGGEGLTVDPFSREALEAYLERFEEAFGSPPPAIRSMFNDSYEVYAANFTTRFFDEFERRRGYDVRPYLRELSAKEETPENIRIQADYRETLSDLLLEEFTIPWDEWIGTLNSISRLQAHGSPGNLLDLYAASGIPEGEIFGSTIFPVRGFRKYTDDTRNPEPDPLMMKFASSAANVSGKKLVSSETFTWAGEHFRVSLQELKPELEQVLLAGVNHIFYHGTSYSPAGAPWPGWLFYASVQFNPNNPFWAHLRGMNDYITRCQSVLQFAKPDNELLVYWPVHDLWHRPGNPDMQFTVHNIGDWLQPSEFYRTVSLLTGKGYSADFVSGRQLAGSFARNNHIVTSPGASSYRAIIIPSARYMPVSDLENILRLAQEGATVIFTEMPSDVPGFHQVSRRKAQLDELLGEMIFTETGSGIKEFRTGAGSVILSADLLKALEQRNIFREDLVDGGLKFSRRDHEEGKYYYIVNHTSRDLDTMLTLNAPGRSAVIMDPQDGRYGSVPFEGDPERGINLRVQIPSGNSLFIKISDKRNSRMKSWQYLHDDGEAIMLDGRWTLTFNDGGPVLPRMWFLEEGPEAWTALPDEEMQYFSGSAEYATEFYLPEITADEYLLCLGDVRESAGVWINGHDAGIVWSNPFSLKAGEYLKEGTNTVRIEVANLMANRIRHMDREGIPWRIFHDINFVSLFYTPFSAADWEVMESGLKGPVKLVPLKSEN